MNGSDKKYNILVAEDSQEIFDLIRLYAEDAPYVLHHALDGQIAMQMFENQSFDIVLLDIMLPKLNGYEVMKKIRAISSVPIIIISAKNQDHEVIIGLDKGADDYLTKPFSPLELMARINVIIRRNFEHEKDKHSLDVIKIRQLVLNRRECVVYKNDTKLELTGTEYKLLYYLMREPGRVFTKNQILSSVWQEELHFDDNIVMVYISRLRDKIEDDPKNPVNIKTVRGLGYKFEKQ